MIFDNEEKLVNEQFVSKFGENIKLLNEELELLSDIVITSRTKDDAFNKYALVMLAGLNLKGIIGAYDRLNKGYLADSETLFKRVIEGLLAEVYLDNNPEEAKKWCSNEIKLSKLENNRENLAKKLDELNKTKQFFKTDMEDFFQEYIYKVGYRNANSVAHMDFESVHTEMGRESGDPTKFAHTLILGPNFNESFMRISLNRLIMFTMFQISYLSDATNYNDKIRVNTVFNKVYKLFSETN